MLVIKIYKVQTLCSSPTPANRDLKAEAHQLCYPSVVGPTYLALYCKCV